MGGNAVTICFQSVWEYSFYFIGHLNTKQHHFIKLTSSDPQNKGSLSILSKRSGRDIRVLGGKFFFWQIMDSWFETMILLTLTADKEAIKAKRSTFLLLHASIVVILQYLKRKYDVTS